MKYNILLSILFFSNFIFAQNKNVDIKIYDSNNTLINKLITIIDDTLFLRDTDKIFKAELNHSKHKIKSILYGEIFIDTTIIVSDADTVFKFKVNYIPRSIENEFNSGFKKVFSNNNHIPIIGLNDSTFIIKNFLHISLIGCDYYEKGSYQIVNDTLYLNVIQFECSCWSTPQKINHTYQFIIKEDKILDIDKYKDFIKDNYVFKVRKKLKD